VPVEALQKLILGAELRLTGKGGDPLVVLEMESGFGKAQSMLALYHIFSGIPASRLPGMEGAVGGIGVPGPLKVQRAMLAGDRISPAKLHHKPDGTIVRTLWGELAWQLGGHDGYEMVRESDERAISPGGSLVFLLQRYSPCLILADGWPAYVLQLHQDSGLPARNRVSLFPPPTSTPVGASLAVRKTIDPPRGTAFTLYGFAGNQRKSE
jgi:hypothetical protein